MQKIIKNSILLFCSSFFFNSCISSQKEWGSRIDHKKWHVVLLQKGLASYYAPSFKGLKTHNGEHYDPLLLTAASTTIPINTVVMVKSERSGRFVLVRINDKGPFVEDRIIDLSEVAAKKIGIFKRGVGKVSVYLVNNL